MNAMKNPPPIDQGLAFQTHALQMILLGPFYVRTQHRYGPPRIVSLHIYIYIYIFRSMSKHKIRILNVQSWMWLLMHLQYKRSITVSPTNIILGYIKKNNDHDSCFLQTSLNKRNYIYILTIFSHCIFLSFIFHYSCGTLWLLSLSNYLTCMSLFIICLYLYNK